MAGIDDKRDPAVIEHFQKLVKAAIDGELTCRQKYKTIKKRTLLNPGTKTWMQGGPPGGRRYGTNKEKVPDWNNSEVYRKDVHKLYSKDNAGFYCKGISPDTEQVSNRTDLENPHDDIAVDDKKTQPLKRSTQKEGTKEKYERILKSIIQIAKEMKRNGKPFNLETLVDKYAESDEFKRDGVRKVTILRNIKMKDIKAALKKK